MATTFKLSPDCDQGGGRTENGFARRPFALKMSTTFVSVNSRSCCAVCTLILLLTGAIDPSPPAKPITVTPSAWRFRQFSTTSASILVGANSYPVEKGEK
jgi:hypothetical protein